MTQHSATPAPYRTGWLSNDAPHEHDRLKSIQHSVDAFTIKVLQDLPLDASSNCLELGAGAGSIAYWLAERCPQGSVVAVDLDTQHLDPHHATNLEIQEADVTSTDYAPGTFDLIHARYLFCHLPQRDEVLARAMGWLAPGGWLIIEEPYHLPAETSPSPLVQRILAAYQRTYRDNGADMTWARTLPTQLAHNGLSEVSFTGNLGHMGGGPTKDRWLPLITQATPAMLATGLITQADLTEFTTLLKDPTFIDIPQVTIAAWGQRPEETPNTH
ncbi:hypothetical protein HEK616_35430 [Streptomyces nigrescens]|uniref:Methyltransferase type 11 domain-containing protein n=1 Tax=Streptomyces nigrescens TaxID=1920 RepID=A0ABM7ZUN7_STRNI|nr:class I SAM-dependent methyltransferase [Streptomyces nigrescens]BDM70056.1 hypothetical protein HEK616_35430 [Streptomyces nigrescens]